MTDSENTPASVAVVPPANIGALPQMLDYDIAREGPMSSFMIRAGLLKDILDELFDHRAWRNGRLASQQPGGEALVDHVTKALYDAAPHKAISPALSDVTGLPIGEVISYEIAIASGFDVTGLRRHAVAAIAALKPAPDAALRSALEKIETLEGELAELRFTAASRTNDDGLLGCPKCQSARGEPYWWHRGQAWIIICRDCKHEEGRESTEGEARRIWNRASEAALEALAASPSQKRGDSSSA